MYSVCVCPTAGSDDENDADAVDVNVWDIITPHRIEMNSLKCDCTENSQEFSVFFLHLMSFPKWNII